MAIYDTCLLSSVGVAGGGSIGAAVASPSLWALSGKSVGKIVLRQSVQLTGTADQIGLAYLNRAKMYFDAFNLSDGVRA